MSWIFQASSEKFDIDDYLSRYPELIYWRTPRYAKEIAVGDRTFIWRAGAESGLIAIGTVVESPRRYRSRIYFLPAIDENQFDSGTLHSAARTA